MKLSNFHNHSHNSLTLQPDEEIDYFLDGKLRIIQSRNGYRFSIDAIILAEFVTLRKGDIVVDLGTGCGIILLLLLLKERISMGIGVEIQEGLAYQACRNAILNGFQSRMHIVIGDMKNPPLASGFADVVVCNPPYRKRGSGRINPDPSKAIARHELLISLEDVISASRKVLKNKGRVALIYPAERMSEVMVILKGYGFEPKRVQIAYPDLSSRASLVLIEACLGARSGMIVEPPIIGQGNYSIPP